ncbi:MAG: ribosome-associated translation inhibitor RaiA [Sedimentisphaerales bacterium]|nr:ribosome-associated translation inhibitor RaiA [Sedimentisphaerales bacterium]
MKFSITGKHMDIPESLREFAEKKTAKLPRYYSSISEVELIIDSGKAGKITIEIIARADRNNTFVVTESGSDPFASLVSAVRKLERQLRRKKGRQRDDKFPGTYGKSTGTKQN